MLQLRILTNHVTNVIIIGSCETSKPRYTCCILLTNTASYKYISIQVQKGQLVGNWNEWSNEWMSEWANERARRAKRVEYSEMSEWANKWMSERMFPQANERMSVRDERSES